MKKYLISEKELIELKQQGYWWSTGDDYGREKAQVRCVEEFLKSKKPIEIIAEGKLRIVIGNAPEYKIYVFKEE